MSNSGQETHLFSKACELFHAEGLPLACRPRCGPCQYARYSLRTTPRAEQAPEGAQRPAGLVPSGVGLAGPEAAPGRSGSEAPGLAARSVGGEQSREFCWRQFKGSRHHVEEPHFAARHPAIDQNHLGERLGDRHPVVDVDLRAYTL